MENENYYYYLIDGKCFKKINEDPEEKFNDFTDDLFKEFDSEIDKKNWLSSLTNIEIDEIELVNVIKTMCMLARIEKIDENAAIDITYLVQEDLNNKLVLKDEFFDSSEKLIEFKHYPVSEAKKEYSEGLKRKYEVTTINWTYANNNKSDIDYDPEKPSPNFEEVHKTKYIFTLEEFIKFSNNIQEVAENIIDIKPL